MAIQYFSGTIKWHRNKELDKYGKRTLDLYPDIDTWAKIDEAGLRVREDKEGQKFVTLSRKKQGFKNGKEVVLGPWEVIDKDGKELTEDVGNGSEVTVKVDIYFSKMANAFTHRVEAVRVENLVEYGGGAKDEVIERPF